MRVPVAVSVAALALSTLAACGPRAEPELTDPTSSPRRADLAPESVQVVMQQKVVHAQALVAAVATQDPVAQLDVFEAEGREVMSAATRATRAVAAANATRAAAAHAENSRRYQRKSCQGGNHFPPVTLNHAASNQGGRQESERPEYRIGNQGD